jgi:hypothetical protein
MRPLTFCSLFVLIDPDGDASERAMEETDAAALLEAEVDEAIALCGGDARAALRVTLIANAFLEAEVERLTEAISTGLARARMWGSPRRAGI